MKRRCDNRQKGAAAVEFAIVLPLLVLLMGGVIEFGIILYDQHVINNATREGARAAIDPFKNLSDGDIIEIVEKYCGKDPDSPEDKPDNLITFDANNTLVVNVDDIIVDVAENITDTKVTAEYTYQFLLPKIINQGATLKLTSTTLMRKM